VQGIRAGFNLNDQIKKQIDKTDVLIVVYTGQQKPSHGFTGLEIGYFIGLAEKKKPVVVRRMISIFDGSPPGTMVGIRGVPISIDRDHLLLNMPQFQLALSGMQLVHPTALMLEDLENDVDAYRKAIGLGPVEPNVNKKEAKRLFSAKSLLSEMFSVLKTRKEEEVNPQRKLVLTITEELPDSPSEIPNSSLIVPDGIGVMSIFGLPEKEISWSDFQAKVSGRYRLFWKDTIENVILTSLGRPDSDNSQIIISFREESAYRVILGSRVKYYNGIAEFHLYFVEILRRRDLGDEKSTNLLKALGLCCRFNFMFLENLSEFSANSISVETFNIKEKVRQLVQELNLLRRDSIEAKLDEPRIWASLLDGWQAILDINAGYAPIEVRIREAAIHVLGADDLTKIQMAKEILVSAIRELEDRFREPNVALIRNLSARLADHY